jgi:glycosyltransferase involved in cell wall biosynthesis
MNSLTINIILPFPVTKPGGGAKIMYEYANRLYERGHQICIYHSIKRPFKRSKTPTWMKQIVFFFRGVARPQWFPLHKNILCKIVPEISDRYIKDADIIFSTWWQMAYAISLLDNSKGKKVNLIQDYENWGGQQTLVDESYKLPIHNMVISCYLKKLVEEKSGVSTFHLPNAIDIKKFSKKANEKLRVPFTIIMLYSQEARKGTEYGLKALALVQQKYPKLKVILFGVFPAPINLPSYISYFQKPDNLNDLYNTATIFFSPSLGEGWALPPAEAMACGCAVVCTDIGGHLDYAIHEQTALLVEPKNINDMSEKIITLLENSSLCNKIADNGHRLITTTFNWSSSTNKLEDYFYNSLKN